MKNILRWIISKLEPIAYDGETHHELEKRLQSTENLLNDSELENERYRSILNFRGIPYC